MQLTTTILAHMEMNRGKAKLNGAGEHDVGNGHGMAKVAGKQSLLNKAAAGEQSRQNKAAAGEHSRWTIRPAQASKKQQPAVGRPHSKTTAADDVGRPLAVQCRLVEGVGCCRPLKRRAQTYPACLPPTYRLCLSLSIPTPLICKTQFSHNFFFHFLSPH